MAKKESKEIQTNPIIASVDGNGIRILERANDRVSAPSVEARVPIVISTDIVDRFEGQTDTWSVWSANTNKEFVARQLADGDVLAKVTTFLMNRSLDRAMNSMIQLPAFAPRDTMFTKPAVYSALLDVTDGDRRVAQVLMELVLPGLVKLGVVSENGRFAQQVSFPFKRVTITALATEVAMIQAFNALSAVRLDHINKDQRQSKQVFAEAFAEAYYPVGLALGQAAELSTVLDDIVHGVRAHLTPPGSVASEMISVPSSWYNQPAIAEFARCLPFIRAALAIPTETGIIRLHNEGANLESWLRLVTEMLRESGRYSWISRNEALRHYGVAKVRDTSGAPVAVVVHRAVRADAVAQAVVAVPDAVLRSGEAFDITATKDRIAEVIQAGYGKADFSTHAAAHMLHGVASDLVSLGYKNLEAGFMVDAYGQGASLHDVAALTATRVYVPFADNEVVLSPRTQRAIKADGTDDPLANWDPQWWYGVDTAERQLRVKSGTHFGDHVLTSDPVEALLASKEFEARDALPARKQVLGPNAFNARVMNFNEQEILRGIDERFVFSIVVDGQKVGGAFRALDFSSLRAARLTKLVRPHYNAEVIRSQADAYATALLLIDNAEAAGDGAWEGGKPAIKMAFDQLRMRIAIKFLQLAQSLSPAFREEVQQAVIERVLIASDAASDRAVATRASLVQDYFTAFCDVIALEFFLFVQGISAEGWAGLARSETLERVCMTMGSDRRTRAQVA